VQHLQRPLVARDVQLVTRRPVEGAAAVRPDLGGDAEAAKEGERAARDGRLGDVEVDGDLAASTQVDATGDVEKPRQLREPVAVPPERGRSELGAEILRE
jgi:hypothetical protein